MATSLYKISHTENLQTIYPGLFDAGDQAITLKDKADGAQKLRPSPSNIGSGTLVDNARQNFPIAITTLGHFNIYKNGQLINDNGKNQHKPGELLKLVIALGSRSVGEVRINDALWPDTDGDVAHTSFSVTLHRIRKSLGMNALQLVDSHLSLNPDYCWVDVWALQKLMGKIKDEINSIQSDTSIVQAFANEALHLYQGHFLGNEDEQPWSIAFREKVKSKFMRCLMRICDYFERQGLCHLAIEYYKKGIEVEPLSEEFYLRLMKCYAKQQRNVEAVAIYQQCTRIFNALTGCNPSADTVAIYRQLSNVAA